MSARPLKAWVVVIVAFAVGLVLARAFLRGPEPPTLERATLYPAAREVSSLALVDQDGRRFDRSALQGHWTLIFFGFTQCPDLCPTTLATLARTRRVLADLAPNEQPRVLLISVDPEHDTPKRLAAYVRFFDPTFLGATGGPDAIEATTRAFGVPFARVAAAGGGYTVDHGAGVFVVSPRADIVAYSSAPHDAQILAGDYRRIVAYDRKRR